MGISKGSRIVADSDGRLELVAARYMRHLRTKSVRKLWAADDNKRAYLGWDAARGRAIWRSFGRACMACRLLDICLGVDGALAFDALRQQWRGASAA
jgi:hypothetical protein